MIMSPSGSIVQRHCAHFIFSSSAVACSGRCYPAPRPGSNARPPSILRVSDAGSLFGARAVQSSSPNLDDPELYLNRDLSWLEFNRRVLEEAQDASVPMLERLKFLAIFSSNLDEFYMVRVAGLKRRIRNGDWSADPAGLTPAEALSLIAQRVHELAQE